jgi:predicted nucleotidyltransferase
VEIAHAAPVLDRMAARLKARPEILDRRREIVDIAARRGASNIRVFGSIARGEGRDDSDVDLIVDIDLIGELWTSWV